MLGPGIEGAGCACDVVAAWTRGKCGSRLTRSYAFRSDIGSIRSVRTLSCGPRWLSGSVTPVLWRLPERNILERVKQEVTLNVRGYPVYRQSQEQLP